MANQERYRMSGPRVYGRDGGTKPSRPNWPVAHCRRKRENAIDGPLCHVVGDYACDSLLDRDVFVDVALGEKQLRDYLRQRIGLCKYCLRKLNLLDEYVGDIYR